MQVHSQVLSLSYSQSPRSFPGPVLFAPLFLTCLEDSWTVRPKCLNVSESLEVIWRGKNRTRFGSFLIFLDRSGARRLHLWHRMERAKWEEWSLICNSNHLICKRRSWVTFYLSCWRVKCVWLSKLLNFSPYLQINLLQTPDFSLLLCR